MTDMLTGDKETGKGVKRCEMNYVVVDFEWNQASFSRGSDHNRIPFEIIEIGAVLLDENLNEIDRFSETIKPKIYKKLHHITRDLTGITQEELDRSDPFPYIVVDFMLWCGDDYTFCTWGNSDLVELQRNMKYYHLDDLLIGPIRYLNVQKAFGKLYKMDNMTASLESAIDFFNLKKDEDFHRALNDAVYTAEVLRQMDLDKVWKIYSVDYFQNPKSSDEELHLVYEDYSKYISREFSSREEAMTDKEVRSTVCYICDKPARKKLHWFAGKGRCFYCLSRCEEHGYLSGRIKFRHSEKNKIYVVKSLKLVDENDAEKLRSMKLDIIKKRRQRRHKSGD